jgi:hypothetical protein
MFCTQRWKGVAYVFCLSRLDSNLWHVTARRLRLGRVWFRRFIRSNVICTRKARALWTALLHRQRWRHGTGLDVEWHSRRWRWILEDEFFDDCDLLAIVVFLEKDKLRFNLCDEALALGALQLFQAALWTTLVYEIAVKWSRQYQRDDLRMT